MAGKERIQREKAMRKEQIIDAAEKLFFTRGFEGTTMDDLAAEAEFSKRTLYVYFASKEEILLEIILRAFKTLNSYIYNFIENQFGATGLEKLRLIAESYVAFTSEFSEYARLIISYEPTAWETLENPVLTQELNREGDRSELSAFIREGIADGSIRNDIDPDTFGVILWGSFTGIMSLLSSKKDYIEKRLSIGPEHIIKSTIDFWISYMKPIENSSGE